jgi:hypothetical protein
MSRVGAFLDQRGPAFARGMDHGRRLGDEIRALSKDVCPPQWAGDAQIAQRAERELEALARLGGDHHVEELDGIAAGSGLPFDEIVRLNLVLGSDGVPGVESPAGMYRSACSAVAIIDPELGAVCGKNGDAQEHQGRWYWVQRVDPGDGEVRYLNVIWPGTIWSDSGMNEHGLALVATSGPGVLEQRSGIAGAVAPRIVLERARDVAEALNLLAELPFSGFGLSFAFADESGATAIAEKVHDRVAVRQRDGGFGWAVNDFLSEEIQEGLQPLPIPDLDESNAVRCEAFRRLCDQPPQRRAELSRLLGEPPIRQCGIAGLWSVHSAVYTPSQLSLLVAGDGDDEWRRYGFGGRSEVGGPETAEGISVGRF